MGKRLPLSDRLWSKISMKQLDGCWEWQASRKGKRYGQIQVDGTPVGAHRIAYQLVKGEIPEGLVVRHRCDNPFCCNPDHLEIGTYQDNTNDMIARQRQKKARGEESGTSKLTEDQVIEIRNSDESLRVLADRFGVSESSVGEARRGKTWTHLPPATKKVNCTRRLTDEQVKQIFLAAGTNRAIGEAFGCSESFVRKIKSRKVHRAITADLEAAEAMP